MKYFRHTLAVALIAGLATTTHAQSLIASENFDGGALNLISSSVPALDGGGGDTHAVGALQAWPTTGGSPFSFADNSVGDVGDTTAFPGDTEGIFGTAASTTNNFLGICDIREFGPVVSTWSFNISSATGPLVLQVGMGAQEGSTFSYGLDTLFTFEVSIDAGPFQSVMVVAPDAAADGYNYRPMDDGVVTVAETNALVASGANPVSKLLAEDGSVAANTVLDKTPASGPGAGLLDTYSTGLVGSGSELTLRLTSFIAFEALVIDNIEIYSVPEPAHMAAVFGFAAILLIWSRRRS
jgi:hypothetical protein